MSKKKKDNDRLGSDPFLPFIQDSRKKKSDDVSDDESISDDENVDVNKSKNNDTNKNVDNDVNINVNNDVNDDENVNNDDYNDVNTSINKNKSTNVGVIDDVNVNDDEIKSTSESTIESDDESTIETANNGQGAITIEKKIKTDNYVRMTHYFRQDQLKAIERLHKQSGRDKSELVRMAVDILIEQARVE